MLKKKIVVIDGISTQLSMSVKIKLRSANLKLLEMCLQYNSIIE